MYQIIWEDGAKEDFVFWQKMDKSIVRQIGGLINSIETCPEFGIGKPEKLKHKFSVYWSRRITQEHRLIYKVLESTKQLLIIGCKGHYENN